MHQYSSLRHRHRSMLIPVVALALCVIVSASVLLSRIVGFSGDASQLMIPLTQSNGVTKVSPVQRVSARIPQVNLLAATIVPLEETKPGFQVEDENTVWEGQTDVEIFRVSYENEQGQVTVNSNDGQKLLAPGTENEYRFTLHNTGDVGLDYTLQIEAYFSDGEKVIPVEARLVDYNGEYLVGSADSYADVLELNNVNASGSISAGYIMPYTLQWQWPFEGNDAYDTWLGNLAEDKDITLTIAIRTTAEYGGEGGIPQTGDTSGVAISAVVLVGSFGGLLMLLLLPKRRTEDSDGER